LRGGWEGIVVCPGALVLRRCGGVAEVVVLVCPGALVLRRSGVAEVVVLVCPGALVRRGRLVDLAVSVCPRAVPFSPCGALPLRPSGGVVDGIALTCLGVVVLRPRGRPLLLPGADELCPCARTRCANNVALAARSENAAAGIAGRRSEADGGFGRGSRLSGGGSREGRRT